MTKYRIHLIGIGRGKYDEIINRKLKDISTSVTLIRAVYGKKNTPKEDREYTIEGSGSSAVATLGELKRVFPNLRLVKIKDKISGDSVERLR